MRAASHLLLELDRDTKFPSAAQLLSDIDNMRFDVAPVGQWAEVTLDPSNNVDTHEGQEAGRRMAGREDEVDGEAWKKGDIDRNVEKYGSFIGADLNHNDFDFDEKDKCDDLHYEDFITASPTLAADNRVVPFKPPLFINPTGDESLPPAMTMTKSRSDSVATALRDYDEDSSADWTKHIRSLDSILLRAGMSRTAAQVRQSQHLSPDAAAEGGEDGDDNDDYDDEEGGSKVVAAAAAQAPTKPVGERSETSPLSGLERTAHIIVLDKRDWPHSLTATTNSHFTLNAPTAIPSISCRYLHTSRMSHGSRGRRRGSLVSKAFSKHCNCSSGPSVFASNRRKHQRSVHTRTLCTGCVLPSQYKPGPQPPAKDELPRESEHCDGRRVQGGVASEKEEEGEGVEEACNIEVSEHLTDELGGDGCWSVVGARSGCGHSTNTKTAWPLPGSSEKSSCAFVCLPQSDVLYRSPFFPSIFISPSV